MKLKITALILALLTLSAVSCGEKKKSYNSSESSTSSSSESTAEQKSYKEVMEETFRDFKELPEGAELSISSTKGKAGERVPVTISVSGAEKQWSMCGIHLTYDLSLSLVLNDELGEGNVLFTEGEAVKDNIGFISLIWDKNIPKELTDQHLGTFFFTTMFEGDLGGDGDIATFYFDIPKDAESGTVYPIGYYFLNTDVFRNTAGDKSFDKYAFEHFKLGSITVE